MQSGGMALSERYALRFAIESKSNTRICFYDGMIRYEQVYMKTEQVHDMSWSCSDGLLYRYSDF